MGTKNNKTNKQQQQQNATTISTNFSTPTATVTGRQFIQNHRNKSNKKSNKQQNSSTLSPLSHDSAIIQCSRNLNSTPNDIIKTVDENQEEFDKDQTENNKSKPVLVSTTGDFLPQNLQKESKAKKILFVLL